MFSARYFAHANINAIDFDAAQEFYTSVFGLESLGPTQTPLPQEAAPFGLGEGHVRWRGAFLGDERGIRGPVVDLLEWLEPPTAQRPAEDVQGPGLYALRLSYGDLEELSRKLEERGRPVGRRRIFAGEGQADFLYSNDLDGVRLEVWERTRSPRFEGIRIRCGNLEDSVAFYHNVLHLDCDDQVAYRVEESGSLVEEGQVVRAYLEGQREKFWLSLCQTSEYELGSRLPESTNTAGLRRMALVVDDIDAAYHDLREHIDDAQPPVMIHNGNDARGVTYRAIPVLFFNDPDGTIVEYLEGVLL